MGGRVGVGTVNGEALAAARRAIPGCSQEELARRSGLSRYYLMDLELGRQSTIGPALRRLAEALGVSPWDLLVLDGSPTLAHLRCAAGLRQSDIAEALGVTDVAYGAIERGKTKRVEPTTVARLAKMLGVGRDTVREALERSRPASINPTLDDDKGRQA